MKRILIILFVVALIIGGMLGLTLMLGVWLPDVVFAPRRTLAEEQLPSGHTFEVIQFWNRVDFYTTELLYTFPDGSVKTHVLDGDDSKSWEAPLTVDEQNRTVTVILGGGRVKTESW